MWLTDFDAGTMPLSEGTKLGNFLCNILTAPPCHVVGRGYPTFVS